jgi:hypothetical protein
MLWDTQVAREVPGPNPPMRVGFLERFRQIDRTAPDAAWCPVQSLEPEFRGYPMCSVIIRAIYAVLGDYAVVGVLSGPLPVGARRQPPPQDPEDRVFLLRPAPSPAFGARLRPGDECTAQVRGRVTGCPPAPPLPQVARDRLVISLRSPWLWVDGRVPAVPTALLMRMYRECMDVPIPPPPLLRAFRPGEDPGWWERMPADNSTRPRGFLFVTRLLEWQYEVGRVLVIIDTSVPGPDGAAIQMQAWMTYPVVLGWSGPWARTDTFIGAAGAHMAREARLATTWDVAPGDTPEFTLDWCPTRTQ